MAAKKVVSLDFPAVYVDEPKDAHAAWGQLMRLLPKITALFSLIAAAADQHDELQAMYQAAMTGEELSEEAFHRANTLNDFARLWRENTPADTTIEDKEF